jgi:outer membrane lipoprotein-sorting protein
MLARDRTLAAEAGASAFVALALLPARAQSPSADDIVAKNLAAKGGVEKLRAVTSVRTAGRMKNARGSVAVTNWTKRPNWMRREIVADGQTQVVAFDGKTLWGINPLMGPKPQVITGPGAEQTRQDADDFDSPLLDYKEKGSKVELVPDDGTAKKIVHLRLTKKNGSVQDLYLNPSTFLEDRITMELEQGGRKAVVATELSNYKEVDGMMVPFTIRQTFNGQLQGEVVYDRIQFNLPLGDDLFRMPQSPVVGRQPVN